MEKQPLISIIVPTFNRAHCIAETITSIIQQTYTQWECLVVDDGSTDETECIVRDLQQNNPHIKWLQRPDTKPKGANACRNFGIEAARGMYLIFLDSDDILKNTCLANRIAVVEKHSNFNYWVFAMGSFQDGKFKEAPARETIQKDTAIVKFLRQDYPWNITGPIWSKQVFSKHVFNEQLQRYQDIAFHLDVLLDETFTFHQSTVTDCYYRKDVVSQQRYTAIDFMLKVAQSYAVMVQHLMPKFSEKECMQHSNHIKFNYYRTLIKFYRKETEAYFSSAEKVIFQKIKLSTKEKGYFYILKLNLKFMKNRRGFYVLQKPLRAYFQNL